MTQRSNTCLMMRQARKRLPYFLTYLSMAFDRVSHEGIIYQLRSNGIPGNVLALMNNGLETKVILNGKPQSGRAFLQGYLKGLCCVLFSSSCILMILLIIWVLIPSCLHMIRHCCQWLKITLIGVLCFAFVCVKKVYHALVQVCVALFTLSEFIIIVLNCRS